MKTHKPFVHLHTHSHYSVLDGMIKIPDLIKTAKELQFPAIALTDHGNMFGAIEFYKKAVKEGVKPIIGLEAYVAPESRLKKEKILKDGEKQHNAYHLILLAKNLEGYHNLLKLASISYVEGFYYKPRIDKEVLIKHHKGLIALSACIQGEISSSIIKNNFMHARRTAYEFKELFGDDFYLEIQNHFLKEEQIAIKGLISLSKELNIPLVATNDVHYLTKDDYEAHEILLCMQTQKKMDEEDRMRLSTNEFHLKSYEEMTELFKDIPEAIENTIKIMDKCNLTLEFGNIKIPKYSLPDNIKAEEYLESLAWKGLKEKYPELSDEVKNQLKYELEIVEKMNFVDYFLIVWDYINYARKNNIMVGAGRGSAAGSILAYTLGITDVDPIKYGLFFERFLNPDRISPPDIDIDFEDSKRDKVIEYVINKYGKDKTAHIITFNKFKAKAAFKAVARVMNISFSISNSISKLINENSLDESYKKNQELRKTIEKDPKLKNIWINSLKLENVCSSIGTHAAGIVISDKPIDNFVPFYMDKEKTISTQYDMDMIKAVGLMKFDFLGLKNLSIIKDSVALIQNTENKKIDIATLPLDDKETYKIMQKGLTKGIFQIENSGITDLFCKTKPKTFPEIGVLIALYRPGPINSGMMESYVRRKNKQESVTYVHKSLKSILEETFGVFVYQEQVMSITQIIGGFTLGEADLIRRAMGKKKIEIIQEQKDKFLEGAKKNKFDARLAESIFTDLAKFAEYAFNKAHSVAYAFITYQTAYLKAHYPAEFLAALLSNEMDKIENITKYYSEVQKFKIEILPPDINNSIAKFNVTRIKNEKGENKKIINFGLAGIKNVGEKLINRIIEERETNGKFKNIMDFLVRLDSKLVNKKILEGLIKAGAFHSLKLSRKTVFENMESLIDESYKIKRNIESGQMSLFMDDNSEDSTDYSYSLNNIIQDDSEWSKNELLKYEKEVLGVFLSDHPLNQYKKIIKKYTKIDLSRLEQYKDNTFVSIVGLISAKKTINLRDNKNMAFLTMEDLNGQIEIVIKPDMYDKIISYLNDDMPILIIRGFFKNVDDWNKMQYKIEAKEIAPIDAPEKLKINNVHIKIPYDIAGNEKNMVLVKDILLKNTGDAKVYLHIYKSDKEKVIMEMPPFLKVKADKNLLNELVQITGENSIYLN